MVTSVPLAFMMWWLYHYGVMPSVGSVAAILIALMRIIHPLRLISELTHLFQKSVVAHAAFNRMINVDLKLPDCQMVDHGIEVEHICYQLGSEMILKDVSLVFPEKEKVAIVGSSGAGKSTLLKMIASIYEPSFGLIKSNASVTYVRQESWLFTASVRENLMFDKVDQEGLIEKVLKDLDMYEWVMSLPNQLDTIIGQGEAMMSGGQMQRLCLARAILKSSQYLLLDEITSALDRVTEKLVMNTILNSEQAVILVTHRLNYLSQFDRVVFMEGGEVVATGHFSDLLNQSQAFKNFYHRLSNQGQ